MCFLPVHMEGLVFDDTTAPTGGEIQRQSFQFAGTCHPCLRCRGLGKWKLFERVPCLNNSYLRPATASWWLSVPALWDVPEPVGTLASWHNGFDGKRKKEATFSFRHFHLSFPPSLPLSFSLSLSLINTHTTWLAFFWGDTSTTRENMAWPCT